MGRTVACSFALASFADSPRRPPLDTLDVFHLWTIRDGRVSRLEIFLDRAAVLEAAGLRE